MEITVAKLRELLDNYNDDNVVECGFEGLTFYKPVANKKFDYVGQIDFGNERKRNQTILNEHNNFQ